MAEVIAAELGRDGLPLDSLGPLDGEQAVIARTTNRRTLGFMNEIGYEARWIIEDAGGLRSTDVVALNHELRRILHSKDGYGKAIELVRRRLSKGAAGS